MWTPKGLVDLHLLVFLHLGTRRVWVSSCTVKPDSAWVRQQARNSLIDAEDDGLPVGVVMRDNDGKFRGGFDTVLTGAEADIHLGPPRSPNLRAHVE